MPKVTFKDVDDGQIVHAQEQATRIETGGPWRFDRDEKECWWKLVSVADEDKGQVVMVKEITRKEAHAVEPPIVAKYPKPKPTK